MQNNIYWYITDINTVPGDNDWLSVNEKKILDKLRFLKRRNEWRLGRWTVKKAIQKYFSSTGSISFTEIEILSKKNGAPFINIDNKESKLSLSISHREQKAICILSDKLHS